ncbi:hypothetical protein MMC12_005106 [Toensbergia leucococca]|nr:hypothetical protein [Toensbergia leucococca]
MKTNFLFFCFLSVFSAIVKASPWPQQDATQSSPVSSASPPSGTGTSSGKRGIAYNNTSPSLDCFDSSTEITWGFNWDSTRTGYPTLASKFNYYPQLWSQGHGSTWHADVTAAIAGGSDALMAFNEPDQLGQSYMQLSDAISGWGSFMQNYSSPNVKLGSPSVTNGPSPMGLTYLQNFISQCGTDCTIDFVCIHWYGGGAGVTVDSAVADFRNHTMSAIAIASPRPVWITEFQLKSDLADQNAFLGQVMPFLDDQQMVHKYAYFMATEGSLISDGALSQPLGQTYAG